MSDAVWKIFFAFAALVNFSVGLPLLLLPELTLELLDMSRPASLLFVQFTGGAISLFGCYYLLVAQNLARRELVWMGIVGKLFAVALFTIYWADGDIPQIPYLVGLGDAVFAAAFLWFLLGGRRAA
jgi:hypothetical protein